MFISEAVSQSEELCTSQWEKIILTPFSIAIMLLASKKKISTQFISFHSSHLNSHLLRLFKNSLKHYPNYSSILAKTVKDKELWKIQEVRESNGTCEEHALSGKQPNETFTPPPLSPLPSIIQTLSQKSAWWRDMKLDLLAVIQECNTPDLLEQIYFPVSLLILSELHVLNPWFQRTPIVYSPFSPKLTEVFSHVE